MTDGSLWDTRRLGEIDYDVPEKIMDDVSSVSVDSTVMVIKTDKSLWVYGDYDSNQLSNDPIYYRDTPRKIMDNVAVADVFFIDGFDGIDMYYPDPGNAMVLKTDRSLWMFIANNYSDPYTRMYDYSDPFTRIMEDVVSFSLGLYHAVAVKSDGSLWTWGNNSDGQLGDGSAIDYRPTPTKIMDGVKLPKNGGLPQPSNPLDSASDWAKDAIKNAIAKGYIPSDLQNNYKNVITRQEFCRMAVMYMEFVTGRSIDAILAEKGLSRTNPFTDTQDPNILAAYALKITSGTSATTFTPNGEFSREQAATMIMNTCRAIGANVLNPPASGFADMNATSSWAVDGVNFCFANGIMNGTGNNMFSPKTNYTREQSIMTFNNIKPASLPGR